MSVCWLSALCLTWRGQLLDVPSPLQMAGLFLASSLVITALGVVSTSVRSQPSIVSALGCNQHDSWSMLVTSKLLLAGLIAVELLFTLSVAQILKQLLS